MVHWFKVHFIVYIERRSSFKHVLYWTKYFYLLLTQPNALGLLIRWARVRDGLCTSHFLALWGSSETLPWGSFLGSFVCRAGLFWNPHLRLISLQDRVLLKPTPGAHFLPHLLAVQGSSNVQIRAHFHTAPPVEFFSQPRFRLGRRISKSQCFVFQNDFFSSLWAIIWNIQKCW